MDVVVLNDVAYVADRTDLTVIDVANPASPTLLGAMPGAGRALAVQDQIAYVLADFQLQIVDVFFKTRPGYIGAIFTGSGFDIVVVNKVAYVAVGEAGIKIIDVSDPGEPVLIADFDTPGLGKGIEVVGSSVYVADGSFGLQVIDISNPAKPSSRGSFLTVGSAVAVTVADGFVYVSCGTAGISVFRAITTTRDQLPFD